MPTTCVAAWKLPLNVSDTSYRRSTNREKSQKVHEDPYCVDDMVWLHSTTIPKGGSKKFHHPWSGPYRVVIKITDHDYRIESVDEKKQTLVVHFNHLKRCVPGTRFSHPPADTADQPSQTPDAILPESDVAQTGSSRPFLLFRNSR